MKEKLDISQIEEFLSAADKLFDIPLSAKTDLHSLAVKFCKHATVCAEVVQNNIVSMVAGYTENTPDDMAYISVVATLPDFSGRGLVQKHLCNFIRIAESKNLKAVHLYTTYSNIPAIRLYEKMGFSKWIKDDEFRTEDLHMILYLHEVEK